MLRLTRNLANVLTKIAIPTQQRACALHITSTWRSQAAASGEANNDEKSEEAQKAAAAAEEKLAANDRTRVIPVETSIKYLKSDAYKTTYGEQFVWEQYRRNHKGMFAPRKTRKTCIRAGKISTGNPCPICRDEYLVLDHRNVDLLQQFISPQTGQILRSTKTGLCQKKHLQLMVAVERARDYGMLTYEVPFREYDYSEYYGKEVADEKNPKKP